MASETPDARDRAVADVAWEIVNAARMAWDATGAATEGTYITVGFEGLCARITAALATARAEEREACVAAVASLETAHECCECSGLLDAQAALRARGEG